MAGYLYQDRSILGGDVANAIRDTADQKLLKSLNLSQKSRKKSAKAFPLTAYTEQFPYALSSLPSVLSEKWDDAEFKQYRDAFPESVNSDRGAFEALVRELTERDVKVAYLKSLQGYLWKTGYESSLLCAPIFPDVPPALKSWHASGLTTVIYSSGSVNAQKLFFQYTDFAAQTDLRGLLCGYYDTVSAGLKTEKSSYVKIAEAEGVPAREWLFLSDNAKEVAAAMDAGMEAVVIVRPGNAPLTEDEDNDYRVIGDFDLITKLLHRDIRP
ncbi:MAG: enolase-phosphatase E1 [Geoglossum umbratile]|nr:MAG: enolase-phosphatase E1 [Geoglossum umbratile]